MSPCNCILPEYSLKIVGNLHTLGKRLKFIDDLQQLLALHIQESYSCLISDKRLATGSNLFKAVISPCIILARVRDEHVESILARSLVHVLNRWRTVTWWRKELINEVLSSWMHVIRCNVVVGILRLRCRFKMIARKKGRLLIWLTIPPPLFTFFVALDLDRKLKIGWSVQFSSGLSEQEELLLQLLKARGSNVLEAARCSPRLPHISVWLFRHRFNYTPYSSFPFSQILSVCIFADSLLHFIPGVCFRHI